MHSFFSTSIRVYSLWIDSHTLFVIFILGDVILWDMNTFQPCGHIKLQDQLTSLTFDSLTKTGVAGGASNFLQLFTINTSYEFAIKLELSITNKGKTNFLDFFCAFIKKGCEPVSNKILHSHYFKSLSSIILVLFLYSRLLASLRYPTNPTFWRFYFSYSTRWFEF